MITANTSKLEQQLVEYKLEVERKLKHMVVEFSKDVAEIAISKTPIGDAKKHAEKYNRRTVLPKIEGIARGNWQFSKTENGQLQLIAGQASGATAVDVLDATANAQYKLGDSFYITNAAPYIKALENNYSSQTNNEGIYKPSLNTVTTLYQSSASNLKTFYDEG